MPNVLSRSFFGQGEAEKRDHLYHFLSILKEKDYIYNNVF